MSWRVDLARDAKKELARLAPAVQKRIARVLLSLEEEPFPRGCKKLKNRDGWRVRVGDYWILYFADKAARRDRRRGDRAPAGRLPEIAPSFAETPAWQARHATTNAIDPSNSKIASGFLGAEDDDWTKFFRMTCFPDHGARGKERGMW